MQAVRDKWTDERLDDLNGRVSEGFARLDAEVRSVRGEMTALRGEMNTRFEAMESRFDAIDARFDALHRLLLGAAGGALGILLTTAGALVATQL